MELIHTERWVPPATLALANITLPTFAPDIDAVSSAYIMRYSGSLAINPHTQANVIAAVGDHPAAGIIAGVGDHPAAGIVAGLADHVVHSHAFISQGLGAPVTNALGLPAALNSIEDAGGAALHTVPGGGVTGIQDNAAAQAHAAGAALAHVAGAALAHVAGGATVVHAFTVATAVVAGVPVKVNYNTLTLSVNTILGDELVLRYIPAGARMRVA